MFGSTLNTEGRTGRVRGRELTELARLTTKYMIRNGLPKSEAIAKARVALPYGHLHRPGAISHWVDAEIPICADGRRTIPAAGQTGCSRTSSAPHDLPHPARPH